MKKILLVLLASALIGSFAIAKSQEKSYIKGCNAAFVGIALAIGVDPGSDDLINKWCEINFKESK